MKNVILVVLLACAFASGTVTAQPGAPDAAGSGPAGGGRLDAGPGNTPGWSMMSPQEQLAHRERMQTFRHYGECASYRDRHRHEMAARAAQRHSATPIGASRDACEGLPR